MSLQLILVRPRVCDLPRFIAKNVCVFETVGRLASAYRVCHLLECHMGTVYMVLNYIIDYKFHLKYEKNVRQVPLNQVIIL